MKVIRRIIVNNCGWVSLKIRCENYIDASQRCWNRATKLAIIQQHSSYSYHQRVWICDACFKIRFSFDDKFKDQLLQVTNLAKNNKNDDINWLMIYYCLLIKFSN